MSGRRLIISKALIRFKNIPLQGLFLSDGNPHFLYRKVGNNTFSPVKKLKGESVYNNYFRNIGYPAGPDTIFRKYKGISIWL